MYSIGLIQHEGKAYSPDGQQELGKGGKLDCGHDRPEVKPGDFTVPWGIVQTSEGPAEYCLDCIGKLEIEAIRVLPRGAGYTAYFVNVSDNPQRFRRFEIQTWHGVKLMTCFDWNIYRHNMGGQFISISARDIHGQYWHGRASYDWGNVINLYKNKVQPGD